MTKKKIFNIAIVGLGNIGTYLYNFLKKNKNLINNKNNNTFKIKYISAKNKRKKRKISFRKNLWIDNYMSLTKMKDVDIIIELIGGSDGPAKKLVFSALKNKKHVITANKALISKYGDKLSKIAEKNKVNLEYEAAVCGGVPIIRMIKESLIGNKVNKIFGIFNGTSNYILSSMEKNKISFNDTLSVAKKLGYAESNPKSDIDGDDVSSKVKILSSLCFGSFVNSNIHVEGIRSIDNEDIINASKLGFKIKLLGFSEIINNKLYQRVHPTFVKKSSYIASVDGVLNAVIVDGSPIGKNIIQGEGAGATATTSALVADISSILRGNIKKPFGISHSKRKKITSGKIDNLYFSSYVRINVKDKYGVLSDITRIFSTNKVSIKRVLQNPYKKYSSILIITHSCKDADIQKTLKTLAKKSYIIQKPKIIRIENG
jgi:homoserine dehydrogenase|tara:strand:+ start:1276 stop:2565 length:1290 start_codon:yes stop_codon:yes gene_type:complete